MKTSKKDFQLFVKECNKWIKIFGLLEWQIHHEHSNEYKDDRAWCRYHHTAKIATFGLTINWSYKPSASEIELCAFHEVMELFLAGLDYMAKRREFDENMIIAETHRIIRTMENVVYPALK